MQSCMLVSYANNNLLTVVRTHVIAGDNSFVVDLMECTS